MFHFVFCVRFLLLVTVLVVKLVALEIEIRRRQTPTPATWSSLFVVLSALRSPLSFAQALGCESAQQVSPQWSLTKDAADNFLAAETQKNSSLSPAGACAISDAQG